MQSIKGCVQNKIRCISRYIFYIITLLPLINLWYLTNLLPLPLFMGGRGGDILIRSITLFCKINPEYTNGFNSLCSVVSDD